MVPTLEWRKDDTGLDKTWQDGLSGEVCVGAVRHSKTTDGWRWETVTLPGMLREIGSAATEREAKETVERLWHEWLDKAGIE